MLQHLFRYAMKGICFLLLTIGVLGSTAGCSGAGEDLLEIPTSRITGVSVRPVEREHVRAQINDFFSDTLRTRIYFAVTTQYEVIDVRLIESSCQDDAGDCWPGDIANPTLDSLRWMRLDTPIYYKGRRIEAGVNLLDDEDLVHSFDGSQFDFFFPSGLSPYADQAVTMKPEVITIEEGWHEIEFGWGTADGEVFSDTVRVYIAL